eukprot:scaffold57799_cov30-Tisochrysis_lutea.AAC.2
MILDRCTTRRSKAVKMHLSGPLPTIGRLTEIMRADHPLVLGSRGVAQLMEGGWRFPLRRALTVTFERYYVTLASHPRPAHLQQHIVEAVVVEPRPHRAIAKPDVERTDVLLEPICVEQ